MSHKHNHRCYIWPDHIVHQLIKHLEERKGGGHEEGIMPPHNEHNKLISDLKAHLAFQSDLKHYKRTANQDEVHGLTTTHGSTPEPKLSVYNMHHSTISGKLPGTPIDQTTTHDDAARDVFNHTKTVWQFYHDVFHRISIDGKNYPLVSSVHFGEEYANAFWNGVQMVYGDGKPGTLTGIASALDVTGHEITHGFVNKECNLEYFGEAGALNESIADIFGTCVKQFHLKQTVGTANWQIGEGMQPWSPTGKALRTFGTSAAYIYDIQPKSMAEWEQMQKDNPVVAGYTFEESIEGDDGGVHILSGIPNRAFYEFCKLLGTDKNAWETPLRVWYNLVIDRNIPKKHVTSDHEWRCSFKEFAELTIKKAHEIGQEVADHLTKAWTIVGVL